MSDTTTIDRLDEGIEALLADAEWNAAASDPTVAQLLAVAAELRAIPARDFKARLKAALVPSGAEALDQNIGSIPVVNRCATQNQIFPDSPIAAIPARRRDANDSIPTDILPTLTRSGQSWYPVRRGSFMASLGAHALMVALLVTSGIWAASVGEKPPVSHKLVTDVSLYPLPPASDPSRGGGGGGDSSKSAASQGNAPLFARDQIVPPAIVVRREPPKLPVEATVVGPPELSFPQTAQMGDPLSAIPTPSNGTGNRGGMGGGERGGVGPGRGPGVGEGWGGGFGGGPYLVGRGVSAPRLIYDPEPEYSDEARKQKYQGVVLLRVVVGEDGRPREVSIAQSLGLGLDEKAQDAVRTWRFEPGRLEGRPVAVVVNIQVNFRLY